MKYQHLFPRSNCMGYRTVSRMQKHCVGKRSGEVASLFLESLERQPKRWKRFMSLKCTLQDTLDWVHYFIIINNTRGNPHSASPSPTYVSICKGFCRARRWLVESKHLKKASRFKEPRVSSLHSLRGCI